MVAAGCEWAVRSRAHQLLLLSGPIVRVFSAECTLGLVMPPAGGLNDRGVMQPLPQDVDDNDEEATKVDFATYTICYYWVATPVYICCVVIASKLHRCCRAGFQSGQGANAAQRLVLPLDMFPGAVHPAAKSAVERRFCVVKFGWQQGVRGQRRATYTICNYQHHCTCVVW